MLRRMVVLNTQQWLSDAWSARSFAVAGPQLQHSVKVRGAEFHEKVYPIPVYEPGGVAPPRMALRYGGPDAPESPAHDSYVVAADFEDEDAIARLKAERAAEVVGVFADPTVEICPVPYCATGPVGTFEDVRRVLGVKALGKAKLTGRKVRVAVVDTGIHGAHPGPDGQPLRRSISKLDAFSPSPGYHPGSAPVDHGTMVAFDILLAAPQATLLDIALLQSTAGSWSSFLSDALAAFAHLIDLMRRSPGPLVVNNSWGMFDRSTDEPVGSPGNYSANPNHPFNRITGALVAAGADVLFAAGNCGAECPDGRCGLGDTGPGQSIHGANSHPSVITVAAVTVKGTRLGYSSQGPGGLTAKKPDIASLSHFSGSGVYKADGGTSAASPVAAGVVAALRQGYPNLQPAIFKAIVQESARRGTVPWNPDTGYGIVDASAALAALRHTAAKVTPSAAAARLMPAAAAPTGDAWMLVRNPPEELSRHAALLKQRQRRKVRAT